MSDAIEAALRGAGLTDKPGEFDSSIHSWRCEYPDDGWTCDCFQSLVDDLVSVERAATEKALEAAASVAESLHAYRGSVERWAGREIASELRRRAEAYRQEKKEQ